MKIRSPLSFFIIIFSIFIFSSSCYASIKVKKFTEKNFKEGNVNRVPLVDVIDNNKEIVTRHLYGLPKSKWRLFSLVTGNYDQSIVIWAIRNERYQALVKILAVAEKPVESEIKSVGAKTMSDILTYQDAQGNTAFHYASLSNNFNAEQKFNFLFDKIPQSERDYIFSIKNKKNQTIEDIASNDIREFLKRFLTDPLQESLLHLKNSLEGLKGKLAELNQSLTSLKNGEKKGPKINLDKKFNDPRKNRPKRKNVRRPTTKREREAANKEREAIRIALTEQRDKLTKKIELYEKVHEILTNKKYAKIIAVGLIARQLQRGEDVLGQTEAEEIFNLTALKINEAIQQLTTERDLIDKQLNPSKDGEESEKDKADDVAIALKNIVSKLEKLKDGLVELKKKLQILRATIV